MNINEDILRASVSILSIAKLLYDHGKLDLLFDYIGSDTDLSWDSQCLVEQCACECVFQDTEQHRIRYSTALPSAAFSASEKRICHTPKTAHRSVCRSLGSNACANRRRAETS